MSQELQEVIVRNLVAYGRAVVRAVHGGDIYASQPNEEMVAQLTNLAHANARLFISEIELQTGLPPIESEQETIAQQKEEISQMLHGHQTTKGNRR